MAAGITALYILNSSRVLLQRYIFVIWSSNQNSRAIYPGKPFKSGGEMKRFTRPIFFIFVFSMLVMGFLFAQEFAGGSGTEADPWQIETAEHLNNVRNYLGTGHSDKHFIQIVDIDLYDATREGGVYWNDGHGWLPVGNASTYFTGNYDGQGHTIYGIYINRSHATIGLFGRTSGAVIVNLGVTNADITGTEYTGGNMENSFTRNRIRNTLIPWLQENVNPKVPEVLYENSLIFSEADEYLRDAAARLLKKGIISQSPGEICLDLTVITKGSRIILFYLIRAVISILTGSETGFYHTHFSQICDVLAVDGSKMIRLPGEVTVRKEYNRFIMINETRTEQVEEKDKRESLDIDISRRFHVFGNRRIMTKRISRNEIKRSYYEDKSIAMLDLEKISFPITVGYRKNGDRFVPMGMSGSKKLKDFFIDEKFSKFERDKVLIFRDREKILWVSGLRMDDRVKLEDDTQSVLLFKVEKIRVRSRKQVLRKKR